ncbi:putative ABC transporter-binding protein [Neobacillus rhizosphaerae]|uniref:ABC transporter-binding protein n=1 Tax=Neobacillus rhizosphaerae TaxID=2880965 RepID=A0ABM9EQU1_9BACI|nr:sugar ABC transporter substrate-binding protein [Neobacillus rhizosphaerae]CAH2714976.1 putative ABC transporter-binding protein [Neobacillus rhizosphaerae]
MKKQALWLVILTLVLSTFIAGCSSKNTDSSSSKSKEITFWFMGDGDKQIKPIVDNFTKETGIKVKIQSIPWGSAHDKLLTAVASKSGPDVVQMGTTYMSEFVDAGVLMDLTDDVKKNETIKPENFFSGSVNTTKFDDKFYAVPWYTETRALYYRTDLLNQVGYDHAPKTWDELYDASLKLSKRGEGKYGFNVDGGEPTFGFMFARQNGSKLFDDKGNPQFNKKPYVDSLKYLEKFIKTGAAPDHDLKLDISVGFGGEGIVPMFISGPWMINAIKDNAPDIEGKWATAELPKGPENNISNTGGSNLAIFNTSKNKDNALKLIEFLAKPENQLAFFKSSSSLPTSQKAWEDTTFTSDPFISTFGKQLKSSEPMPLMKEWDQITQAYLKEWEQIYSAGKDVQKSMDDLNAQTKSILGK